MRERGFKLPANSIIYIEHFANILVQVRMRVRVYNKCFHVCVCVCVFTRTRYVPIYSCKYVAFVAHALIFKIIPGITTGENELMQWAKHQMYLVIKNQFSTPAPHMHIKPPYTNIRRMRFAWLSPFFPIANPIVFYCHVYRCVSNLVGWAFFPLCNCFFFFIFTFSIDSHSCHHIHMRYGQLRYGADGTGGCCWRWRRQCWCGYVTFLSASHTF